MNTSTIVRGFVAPLSSGSSCKVALVDGETEYRVLPRGAGIDLADMVSAQIEAHGTVTEEDDARFVHVRSYNVIDADDESW